jgi:hypothetical protein
LLNTVVQTNNPSNPSWQLQTPINNVSSFLVDSFVGINTIQTIDSRNNKLYWNTFNTAGATITHSSTIPTGYYNISTFLPALTVALNGGSTTGSFNTTVSNTSFLSITNTSASFVITTGSNSINYETGMMNGQYGFANQTSNTVQNSVQSYDLSGVKCLNVVCNNLGVAHNNYPNSAYKVLTNIPVPGSFGAAIVYEGDLQYCSSPMNNVNRFEIQFLDERNRRITENLLDFQMSLFIRTV